MQIVGFTYHDDARQKEVVDTDRTLPSYSTAYYNTLLHVAIFLTISKYLFLERQVQTYNQAWLQ
jgi:hypothetical protein